MLFCLDWVARVRIVFFGILVSALAAQAQGASSAGLLALYDFSEGSGAVVHDVSGVGAPLDLRIADTASTRWLPGGGLDVLTPTLIASTGAATKISQGVKASNEITIEAWIRPASTTLHGPARIVTLSSDPYLRDFTLGQENTVYDVRLRTTRTDANGMPSLGSPSGILTTGLAHVVFTRDSRGRVKLYVNGVQQASGRRTGDLRNWDAAYRFALANELSGDRPWQGSFYQVALYSRAFSSTDVSQHFADGAKSAGTASAAGSTVSTSTASTTNTSSTGTVTRSTSSGTDSTSSGLLALYDFGEGSGAVVHDVSGVGAPLDLNIADAASTRWLPGGGLNVLKPTLIASARAASKVSAAIKSSNEITVEAWIQPASTTLSGPARIVTLSADPYLRNFTLGQQKAVYDVRLRTTATDQNGMPSLGSTSGMVKTALTHVVYTRNAKGQTAVYVNGVKQASATRTGDLGNWDGAYRFALANELSGGRPWQGSFYRVALYSRALADTEIAQHFVAGAKAASTAATVGGTAPTSTTSTATGTGSTSGGTGSTATVAGQTAGTASLSWSAPSTRSDGVPLSLAEIAGYTLYYGTAPGRYANAIRVNGAYTTAMTVTDLPRGTYYFVVTARDTTGKESGYSRAASRTVP